jgi:hypothetical protein
LELVEPVEKQGDFIVLEAEGGRIAKYDHVVHEFVSFQRFAALAENVGVAAQQLPRWQLDVRAWLPTASRKLDRGELYFLQCDCA